MCVPLLPWLVRKLVFQCVEAPCGEHVCGARAAKG